MTLPLAPLSLPAMTTTVSPFLIFMPAPPVGRRSSWPGFHCACWFARCARSRSQHLRRQADDLHEPLVAQLAADRAEDAGTAGVATVLDDHGGVLVEPDVRAVGAALLLGGTDDDRLDDVALLHTRARDGVLDRGHDDVADARVTATGAAQYADAQDLPGTRVVGDAESRLLLDHVCLLCLPVLRPPTAARAWRNEGPPGRRRPGALTWPFRGSPRPATAWWRTADGSPSSEPGRRCRTRSARRAPSACWSGGEPCRRERA